MTRIVIFVVVLVFALGIAAWLFKAEGQELPTCNSPEGMAEQLFTKYQERPRARGDSLSGPIILFVAPSGTWTVTLTQRGRSCIVGVGTNWKSLAGDSI